MAKTAIFGGTFDPPHKGHVQMLKELSRLTEIEKILVMPAKAPPHKGEEITPAEHRIRLCEIAFGGIPGVELSLVEHHLAGKSYTVNTLKHLRAQGVAEPVLVLGADSLINFTAWYQFGEILSLCELYVYGRHGFSDGQLRAAADQLTRLGGRVTLLDIYPCDVSSTEVRRRLAAGQPVSQLLEQGVEKYIIENKLYGGNF